VPAQAKATVAALAGRRIDAGDAPAPRFPLASVPKVRRTLHDVFVGKVVGALVSSAACGADLIALEVAGALGIRRRVVLPFSKERFRETSVVDRPGDWGPLYDRVIAEIEAADDLVVLGSAARDADDVYQWASAEIVRQAELLANASPGQNRMAVIVWEGAPRSVSDATEGFRKLAEEAGFTQCPVLTL